MRATLEQWLNRTWYGERPPGLFLRLLEQLYRGACAVARRIDRRNRAVDLEGRPIIVVGNLTAGGAGKTPLVIRLCELAEGIGLSAGVISRGYGRESRQPVWARPDARPVDCGDEPLLIALRTGVPVRVDSDRERAARQVFQRGVDLVISDDGLQRQSLPRRLELCVVDGERGFGNGRQLPAGPLREPAARLADVDYVVENLAPGGKTTAMDRFGMRLEPGRFTSLGDAGEVEPAEFADRGKAHAVAGIAMPARFLATLGQLGIPLAGHTEFPDHHRFRREDFDHIPPGIAIVMTEKDAVKCRGLDLPNAWYLPVSAALDHALESALAGAMRELCPGDPGV